MVTLARPVEGIAPVSINKSVQPLNKSLATIVGFGRTGGSRHDYGIKREGSARTQACTAPYADQKLLCWAYDADVKTLRRNSNTCNGDSGGGVFMRDSDGGKAVEKVFGVVSGGRDGNCVKDDLSYNVDVHQFRAWIEATGEGRLGPAMCGRALSAKAEPDGRRLLARLGQDKPEVTASLTVPPGVGSLRIAMNGADDGSGANDFDLAVYKGGRTPDATPICKEDGAGQFAFCNINHPASGLWTIVASRKTGEGNVQITTTFASSESK